MPETPAGTVGATPRPWRVFNGTQVVSSEGRTIADCQTTRSIPGMDADAELIVLAVNSYDATQAQLGEFREVLLSFRLRENPKDKKCPHCWCNTWDWTKHNARCQAARE